MDPLANQRQQRGLADEIDALRDNRDALGDPGAMTPSELRAYDEAFAEAQDCIANLGIELAKLVQAYREWRGKGGFAASVESGAELWALAGADRYIERLKEQIIQAARNIAPDNDDLIESSDDPHVREASLHHARAVLGLS
jgi:hypothetical protein